MWAFNCGEIVKAVRVRFSSVRFEEKKYGKQQQKKFRASVFFVRPEKKILMSFFVYQVSSTSFTSTDRGSAFNKISLQPKAHVPNLLRPISNLERTQQQVVIAIGVPREQVMVSVLWPDAETGSFGGGREWAFVLALPYLFPCVTSRNGDNHAISV